MLGNVVAIACDGSHRFSKRPVVAIDLIAGIGVRGDAHAGATVRHRSRVAVDPAQPNLGQVHLLSSELLAELRAGSFAVAPADLGENITTAGLDLMALPVGPTLRIGPDALLSLTGLRNPCAQIDRFRPGLLRAVLERAPDGAVIRRAEVMAVVVAGGCVRSGDAIAVALPPPPHRPLDRV